MRQATKKTEERCTYADLRTHATSSILSSSTAASTTSLIWATGYRSSTEPSCSATAFRRRQLLLSHTFPRRINASRNLPDTTKHKLMLLLLPKKKPETTENMLTKDGESVCRPDAARAAERERECVCVCKREREGARESRNSERTYSARWLSESTRTKSAKESNAASFTSSQSHKNAKYLLN
jgi:hypothetical protein